MFLFGGYETETLGEINTSGTTCRSGTDSTKKTCMVLRLKEKRDTLVVNCDMEVQADQAHSWCLQVHTVVANVFKSCCFSLCHIPATDN